MTETDSSYLTDLADIYKALGNETRLQLLFQIKTGNPISELADGISRSGLQKHVEALIDSNLVYRPVDSSETYSLTALGQLFLAKIEADGSTVEDLLDEYRSEYEGLQEQEQETLARMQEAGIDTKELEDKLTAEAWEKVQETVESGDENETVDLLDPSDEDVGGLGGGMNR